MLEMRTTEAVEDYDLCPEGYEYDEMATFITGEGVEASCENAARACARDEECDPMFFLDTDCCGGEVPTVQPTATPTAAQMVTPTAMPSADLTSTRHAEETTEEPSECACSGEIEMLVDTLRSDLQTQLPAQIEAAFGDVSSDLSQQLISTLQPIFLQLENFSNMPDDLKEALTTSLAGEFVPVSALQTIFETLDESLRTSLSTHLAENYVSKEELADMPAQMQEDLQNSLSPYFMGLADLEDLANLDVNLGSALAETLPNIFATKEEVDSLSATVSMLEMDSNEVMTGMSDMASCMADIAGSMGSDDGSEEETPVETAAPTTLGRLMESGPNKCSTSSSDRAFRLTFTTLDNCLQRCSADSRCQYASTNFMTGTDPMYCIGCINLTQTSDDWMAYDMSNNRRQLSSVKQLSEVERLRAENQRLRSELTEARRN